MIHAITKTSLFPLLVDPRILASLMIRGSSSSAANGSFRLFLPYRTQHPRDKQSDEATIVQDIRKT
jgi:hypothetical protein